MDPIVLAVLGNLLLSGAVALLGTLLSKERRFTKMVRDFLVRLGLAQMGISIATFSATGALSFLTQTRGWILPWWSALTLNEAIIATVASSMLGLGLMGSSLFIGAALEEVYDRVKAVQLSEHRETTEYASTSVQDQEQIGSSKRRRRVTRFNI